MKTTSTIALLLSVLAACGPSPAPDVPQNAPTDNASMPSPSGPTEQPRANAPANTPAASTPAPRAPVDAKSGLSAAFVAAHNRAREKHCAPPVTWSPKLEQSAQAWADKLRDTGCRFNHSDTSEGENLAAGSTGSMDPDGVVELWYRESADYQFAKGGFSMKTGHFTQVVWRGTREIGCGKATCNGNDLWVCQYSPAGNVEGGYADNVKPTTCKSP